LVISRSRVAITKRQMTVGDLWLGAHALRSQITNQKSQMKIARQFERRGPLWLPSYAAKASEGRPSYVVKTSEDKPRYELACRGPREDRPVFPPPAPRPERGLPRFERWRKRFCCAWTHVNGAGNEAGAATVTVTLGFTPAAGSLLVALVAGYTASGSVSISDNSSGPADSWSAVTAAGTWGTSTNKPFQAFACNVTSGTAPTTVTGSCTSSSFTLCVVDCYTGGPNPFVQDGSGVTASGNTAAPSASFTTGSQANDLLWSGLGIYGSNSATVSSPFTARTQASSDRVNTADDGIANSVAASTQYSATWSITSSYWCEALVGFQSGAALDEDFWAAPGPSGADPTVTVWG
jgi:hypothetical protein